MTRGFGRFIKALFVSYLHGRIISFSTKKSQSLAAHLNWSWLINKKNKSLWNNNHCCLWDRWLYHSMSHQLPMASTMKKHFFFSPRKPHLCQTDLHRGHPKCRSDSKRREERKKSQQCAVTGTELGCNSSTVGLDMGSHFPGKGNKSPFPIVPFPSDSLGPLELWYR